VEERSVQLHSSDGGLPERTFQLTPRPTERWWTTCNWLLARWLGEVGRLPPEVEVRTAPPDEIVVSGVTESNAFALERGLKALVRAVNRDRAKPPSRSFAGS
jgi:hypothetical protein